MSLVDFETVIQIQSGVVRYCCIIPILGDFSLYLSKALSDANISKLDYKFFVTHGSCIFTFSEFSLCCSIEAL
jgi:hypothetical protein